MTIFDNSDEHKARVSRIRTAVSDGIDGLIDFKNTGEYDSRINSLNTAFETAQQGEFPPLENDSDRLGTEEILTELERLDTVAKQIKETLNRDEFDLDELIETAIDVYESLEVADGFEQFNLGF